MELDGETTGEISAEPLIDLNAPPREEPEAEPAEGRDPQLVMLSALVGALAIAVVVVFGMIIFDPVALISLVPNWFAEPGSSRVIGSVTIVVVMCAIALAVRQLYLRRRG
ncbi:hypothetical protein FB565_002547 [Actinoplanes lutulentus]|uniref:hypothetical protein n=1 Tax=Actinoplanes lutulentus TaxID=1287878 RepID=UPI0011B94BC6|nr:hypothetical protein [Actinoplanes lutulentus]MBB2942834.1 hypothetical protein [Actinoplanes lutulentus]